jgi:predicted component of type VI protein secretion system
MFLALSIISSQGTALGHSAYKIFDGCGGSIGRFETNDWMLPDPDRVISGRHAVLHTDDDEFYLEDTSTNGTFVNARDRPVSQTGPVRLQDGDRIYIGEYEILVQLIDQEPVTRDSSSLARPDSDAPHPRSARAPTVPARTSFIPDYRIPSDPERNAIVSATLFESAATETPATDAGELLAALGLDNTRVDPAIYRQLGLVLRIVVQGMIEVLQSRIEVKNQFRMPMTTVKPVENNPLKFSLNADQVLDTLFIKRNPGYLGPMEAFSEGFQDIAFHQLAMLAGVRAAFDSMLAKFHPDQLEQIYQGAARRGSLRIGKRGNFWAQYRQQYEDMEKDRDAAFQLLFGEEFARAYHEQLDRLGQSGRPRSR